MKLNIKETDLSVEPGMDAIECGGYFNKEDGSSFEVKMRVDFPENEAMAALRFMAAVGSEDTLFAQAKEFALRGDKSCQQYMIEVYEEQTGEKAESFADLLESNDEDQKEG